MKEPITQTLKLDWDQNINPPISSNKERNGHFSGREHEADAISNELYRNDSGAILISGHRGVGKTSLVFESIWRLREKKKSVITVLLNSAQLESEFKSQNIAPRSILEFLIRRLYAATKDSEIVQKKKGLSNQLNKLYLKAAANQYKLQNLDSQLEESEKSTTTETESEFKIDQIGLKTLLLIASMAISVFLLFMKLESPFWDTVRKFLIIGLAYPIPFAINIVRKKIKKSVNSKKSELSASLYYELDNSLGNLEFDLENVHRKFKEENLKLVYLIDELDKLNPTQVGKILNYFKSLFNLSNAHFLFLGDEDLYRKDHAGKSSLRAESYTYFNTKYFIARAQWNDFEKYFDKIFINKNKSPKKRLECLIRSMSFEAKNDFFDLKDVIKDRLWGFDNQHRPVINLDGLSQRDYELARLHKCVSLIFDAKYKFTSQSKWSQNEDNLRNLFAHIETILSQSSENQIADPSTDSVIDAIIRDFNKLLVRIEAFELIKRTSQKIGSNDVEIGTYKYLGIIPNEPPISFDDLTEFEKAFVNEFENYLSFILVVYNLKMKLYEQNEISLLEFISALKEKGAEIAQLGYNFYSQIEAPLQIYNNLTSSNNTSLYKIEEMRNFSGQINGHLNSFKANSPAILSNLFSKRIENTNTQTINQNGAFFSGPLQKVRQELEKSNPRIIFKSNMSQQVMLVKQESFPGTTLLDLIKENSESHLCIFLSEKTKTNRRKGIGYINYGTIEDFTATTQKASDRIIGFFKPKEEPQQ